MNISHDIIVIVLHLFLYKSLCKSKNIYKKNIEQLKLDANTQPNSKEIDKKNETLRAPKSELESNLFYNNMKENILITEVDHFTKEH